MNLVEARKGDGTLVYINEDVYKVQQEEIEESHYLDVVYPVVVFYTTFLSVFFLIAS